MCDLADSTGDLSYFTEAEKIASAFIKTPINYGNKISGIDGYGILTEWTDLDYQPLPSIDSCAFKGIFIRNLAYLYVKTKNAKYRDFILKNATAALNNMNNFRFDNVWDSPPSTFDFVRQAAGLHLLNAALIVQSVSPSSELSPLLDDRFELSDLSYLNPILLS